MKKFSLSGNERLKGKKQFDLIYATGRSVISGDKKLKAVYTVIKSEKPGVKMAAAVSKKAGSAVWRNRIKRLIKESYRLNKITVITICNEKKLELNIIFSSHRLNEKINKVIGYHEIWPSVTDIINRIQNEI